MIIANPLYDVVFKYLLEDIDIAREIIATILGEDIIDLEVNPQETATEILPDGNIRILRFDFKATIETATGDHKKVLIELQKIKLALNVVRFRRYLGDNYGKLDNVILGDGTIIKIPLPIVTIYILGFPLEHLKHAVVKIDRQYKDVLTGQIIEDAKDDFVELLTHDSYFIQVRLLPAETKTKLERILQIFNPKFKTEDTHKLNFTGNTDDLIVQKIVNRLQRAIISEELRRKMDFEDDFYSALEDEYNKGVAEEAAKKDIIIAEKDQALIEKEQALIEKDQEIELLMRQLADFQKQNRK
ncbi:MAG: hypothetical protein U5L45_23390 [Saprospiraceae bacterium]|nr:hypothetical protein [Saprospiraceae bacterium]